MKVDDPQKYQDRLNRMRINNQKYREEYNAMRRELRAEHNRLKAALRERAGTTEAPWQPFIVPSYLK